MFHLGCSVHIDMYYYDIADCSLKQFISVYTGAVFTQIIDAGYEVLHNQQQRQPDACFTALTVWVKQIVQNFGNSNPTSLIRDCDGTVLLPNVIIKSNINPQQDLIEVLLCMESTKHALYFISLLFLHEVLRKKRTKMS